MYVYVECELYQTHKKVSIFLLNAANFLYHRLHFFIFLTENVKLLVALVLFYNTTSSDFSTLTTRPFVIMNSSVTSGAIKFNTWENDGVMDTIHCSLLQHCLYHI